jgi:hypothetical protein
MHLPPALLLFLGIAISPLQLRAFICDGEGVPAFRQRSDPPYENCTQALSSLLRNVTSHTTILLQHEVYILDEFILIQDVINITLDTTGDSSEPVFIRCPEDPSKTSAGLAFINVTDLTIRNLVVVGCGFTEGDISNTVSQLREVVNIFYTIPSSVQISLLLGNCEDVLIEQVSIANAKGFGLVGINVVGTPELINVTFFNNTNPGECDPFQNVFNPSPNELANYDSLGGAAVFMYFDYLPGQLQTRYRGSRTTLNLQNCNFTLNSECSLAYLNLLRSPSNGESSLVASTGYALGGSGALGLALAQLEYGVTVNIASSRFYDNTATFGSGSTITTFVGTDDIHVVFDDCAFDKSAIAFFNDARQPENVTNTNPGSFSRNVTFSVLNSNFTNSVEIFAGSTLLIYSNYFSEIISKSVLNVFIDRCIFRENRATVGSAMAIYENKINGFSLGMQVSIKDSHFVNNKAITTNQDAMFAVSQSASTVDIRNVNLTLYGNCSFVGNIGTGIKAESSVIGVSGNVTFLRNTGINGGALALITYSYLIMNRKSSIYFVENVARIGGGAIYVNENTAGSYRIGGFVDCFIHFAYDDFIVCDNCSDLNSYGVIVEFQGNVAAYAGSMVSGSSLATCPWAQQLRKRDNFNRSVFQILAEDFPSVFIFDQPPNNSMVVQSTAARLDINNYYEYTDNMSIIEVFPGERFNLNISALDDFEQVISSVVTAFATTADDDHANNEGTLRPLLGSTNFAVLETNHSTGISVAILGSENQNISLIIYSTDSSARAQLQLNITLLSCGVGFEFDSSNSSCVCDPRLLDRDDGISCDSETHTISIGDGAWVGTFRGKIIVDMCLLFGYCRAGETLIKVNSSEIEDVDFDLQCDPESNRVGFLCSECKENHSAVLGTRNCKLCTNWYLFLLIFFITIGIVAIMIIQYLNITITAGYINGVIFYSNIISIYGPTIVPGNTYNEALVLVSFPSLSLGIETCFYNGMTILHRVLWQLSFPIYLFILMAVFTLLSGTKRWMKCMSWLSNRQQSPGSSTIKSFATLLIVCYISVLGACTELIAFNRVYTIDDTFFLQWRSQPTIDYFGREHSFPGVIAFLILVLYIIPLPLFLLFPSILYRNRYTNRFKPIFDTFWDPYKPQYRYFLGFRLIFLILPFFLAVTVRPPLSLFITNFFLILYLLVHCLQQPYQEKWRNYIDAAFVCNLVLILSGSIYFWSEYNNSEREERRDNITLASRIYTNIFIILGFVLIVGIIVYHIMLKLPEKTKKRIRSIIFRRKNQTEPDEPETENTPHTNSINGGTREESSFTDSSDYREDGNGTMEATRGFTNPRTSILPPVRTVELREPLLESGSLSYHQVDTSFVPRAVQDFISDLRH